MAHGTLVDSNVLLDILTEDAIWQSWSRRRRSPTPPRPVRSTSTRSSSRKSLGAVHQCRGARDAFRPQDYRREAAPVGGGLPGGQGLRRLPAEPAARSRRHCLTSSSAPTQRLPSSTCSPETRPLPDLLPDRDAHLAARLTPAVEQNDTNAPLDIARRPGTAGSGNRESHAFGARDRSPAAPHARRQRSTTGTIGHCVADVVR